MLDPHLRQVCTCHKRSSHAFTDPVIFRQLIHEWRCSLCCVINQEYQRSAFGNWLLSCFATRSVQIWVLFRSYRFTGSVVLGSVDPWMNFREFQRSASGIGRSVVYISTCSVQRWVSLRVTSQQMELLILLLLKQLDPFAYNPPGRMYAVEIRCVGCGRCDSAQWDGNVKVSKVSWPSSTLMYGILFKGMWR
jgi:hypothetical protein